MRTQETVEGFTSALEAGDFDTAAAYLADDFQFSNDRMPEPLGRDAWLQTSRALKQGVPDLSYNFRIEEIDGNAARVSSELEGTHTADLDLTSMGIGVIPTTGRYFRAGREYSEGEVDDHGYVRRIHVFTGPDTGVGSMLAQLGIEAPGG